MPGIVILLPFYPLPTPPPPPSLCCLSLNLFPTVKQGESESGPFQVSALELEAPRDHQEQTHKQILKIQSFTQCGTSERNRLAYIHSTTCENLIYDKEGKNKIIK